MNTFIIILLILAIAVPIRFIWLFSVYRMKKGKYIKSSVENNLSFITDFGLYRLDNEKRKFIYKDLSSNVTKIDFNEIVKIKYEYKHEPAWALEILTGAGAWIDNYAWHTVFLIMKNGNKIPLFIAGQYQRKEMIMCFVNFEKAVLQNCGMYKDISKYVQIFLDSFMADFKSIDINISLTR